MPEYLLSVHGSADAPIPSDETIQKMYAQVDALNQEIKAAGAWVFAGGLQPASTARVVDASGEQVRVTEGPYLSGRTHIGGFWVVEAEDDAAAAVWARKGSAACLAPVEVRPFQVESE